VTATTRTSLGPVAAFTELPTALAIGSRTFFLVADGPDFRLLSNVCPHQGGPVYDEGSRFQCPVHGWQFDRQTGQCLNAPSHALSAVPVWVEDGVLYADLAHEPHVRRGRLDTKVGVTVHLHAHACLEIAHKDFTLLTDPWLDGPAFFGSWTQYPAADVSGADLHPDAILITHEHSDHFHETTLRLFDRDTPVYVPDFPNQRLARRLAALGFRHVTAMRFGEQYAVQERWQITVFEPESYWNDALALIDVEGFRILDINDAGVNARIARMVAPVDVVAVQFSAGASGYPWTWSHLSDDQKVAISAQACAGKLDLIREAAAQYGASAVLPFASHFALWHPTHDWYSRMMRRNSLDDVKRAMAGTDVEVIDLLPGDTWDVGASRIRRSTARADEEFAPSLAASPAMTAVDQATFEAHHPADESLSRDELIAYLMRLNAVPEIVLCEDLTVRIRALASGPDRLTWEVSFTIADGHLSVLQTPPRMTSLGIDMPLGLLTAVIRGDLSWDEAFIGYWCRFTRDSNVYHAGFWRLFQAPYFNRRADPTASLPGLIDPASTVAEVLEAHGAEADRILRRYGLYCSGCQHSTTDSIEMAVRQHGVDARRAARLIRELNSAFPTQSAAADRSSHR
jgi:CMP-N-acetylneuraminate monooxygenase